MCHLRSNIPLAEADAEMGLVHKGASGAARTSPACTAVKGKKLCQRV